MSTSEDHSKNYNPGGHTQPGTTQMEYAPEDFSQAAINRGQRQINYALTVVDKQLSNAIKALKDAIAASPAGRDIDFAAVDDALSEAYETGGKVADIKPPGCDSTWD